MLLATEKKRQAVNLFLTDEEEEAKSGKRITYRFLARETKPSEFSGSTKIVACFINSGCYPCNLIVTIDSRIIGVSLAIVL